MAAVVRATHKCPGYVEFNHGKTTILVKGGLNFRFLKYCSAVHSTKLFFGREGGA